MTFAVQIDREPDGRWLADVPSLPGVMCYAGTREEALARVQALALRVIAERLEQRESPAELLSLTFTT
jgi:predicted RNase H-like HicB family nuclease